MHELRSSRVLEAQPVATFNDANNSEAWDINDLGELVGASDTFAGQYHAMYKPRTGKNIGWHDLGVLGQGTSCAGNWCVARGINNKGIIVGQSNFKGPGFGISCGVRWSTAPSWFPIKATPVRNR